MNEQLQKQLSQFLQLMLDGIEKGTSFAGQQLPLIIQEKLHYELFNSLMWAGFWFLIIVAIWVMVELFIRKSEMRPGERYEGRAIATTATLIISVPMVYCLNWALYIYMAPRLYILEWLRQLIR
jgi:hypothetical protein